LPMASQSRLLLLLSVNSETNFWNKSYWSDHPPYVYFLDVCTWSHGLLIQQSPSAFQNLTVRGQMVCCNPTLRFLVTAEQSLAPISKRHKF
jgi:hypothetical protein